MLNINLNLPTIPTQDEKDAMDGANTPSTTNVFATINDVPTKTSDLVNDGDDGNAFISLNDLPSNIVLYPTTVASDIGGYFKMVQSITDPNYNTVAVDVSTGAISGTAQLISSLATSANVIVGNPGVFDITTIGNIRKVSGTGEAEFFFSVYKRNLAGTETLIIQSNNTLPVTNGGYAEFSATGLWNDGLFISTDRIVIKYYANRIAGGSNPTYEFQFGGSLPVRTLVPIPLTVVPFITLDEVADVTISGVADNDLLAYDNATSLWKNKTASALGIAETTDSRFNNAGEWVGLVSAVLNPADSTAYLMPFVPTLAPATGTPAREWKFTKSGTVLNVVLASFQQANGSSEDVTVYLRNTTTATDYLCGTFTMDGGLNANTYANFSVSIAINTTDKWAIKILTPAWVTNPTNVYFSVNIFNKS